MSERVMNPQQVTDGLARLQVPCHLLFDCFFGKRLVVLSGEKSVEFARIECAASGLGCVGHNDGNSVAECPLGNKAQKIRALFR